MNPHENKRAISIVIPALNERPNLELLLPAIFNVCRENQIECEAIVIDSDSDDGTEQYVRGLEEKFSARLLNEPVRGDLALAWTRGISAASHPIVATMDADMCHSPDFIPHLLDSLEKHDMVIASRYLKRGRQMRSKYLIFEIISRVGQILSRFALQMEYTDISHGFRIFRKDMFDALRNDFTATGNSFMICFTMLAHKNNYSIHEIPYAYGKREHGKDKMRATVEIARSLGFLLSQWKKNRRA